MSERIRLLLVDDEEDFVAYMGRRLESRGFEVISFTDPTQVFEGMAGREFDLALLDLRMPGLDGEELVRRIKARDSKVEIVVLTAHGSVQSAFRSIRDGAFDFLQKPCDADDLLGTLCKAYAKRIRGVHHRKLAEVDELLLAMRDRSPADTLRELKQVNDRLARAAPESPVPDGEAT